MGLTKIKNCIKPSFFNEKNCGKIHIFNNFYIIKHER